MREIALDAANWSTPLDFYAAVLPALGAPEWHGQSIAAIADSMIGGGINVVAPPYVVTIRNLAGRPAPVVEEVEHAEGAIAEAREFRLACYDESVEAHLEIAGGERARRRISGEVDPEAPARRAVIRAEHEEGLERLREQLRPYAPFNASQLRFGALDAETPPGGRGGERRGVVILPRVAR